MHSQVEEEKHRLSATMVICYMVGTKVKNGHFKVGMKSRKGHTNHDVMAVPDHWSYKCQGWLVCCAACIWNLLKMMVREHNVVVRLGAL